MEIVASTATAVILVGAVIFGSGNGEHNEIDIAIGSAGSESVIATLHYLQSTQPSCPCFFPFATPLDLVPASSRISARNRTDDLSAIVGVSIALLYVEKPL